MTYNEIGCRSCGAKRPRWHGGSHHCIVVGTYLRSIAHSAPVTEQELGFLRIPGPVA